MSAESLRGGHACNTKRQEAGLAPLEVLCMPLVDEAGGGGEVREDAEPSFRGLHPLTHTPPSPPARPYQVSEDAKLSSSGVRKACLASMCTACALHAQCTPHTRALHTACSPHAHAHDM